MAQSDVSLVALRRGRARTYVTVRTIATPIERTADPIQMVLTVHADAPKARLAAAAKALIAVRTSITRGAANRR